MDNQVPHKLVEAEEYCRLAISHRKLLRADDKENGLRGLLDPEEGVCYMISEQKLFSETVNQRPLFESP